ncbi:MAG: T9SS type A sorting domain-containing protein [Bacteroidetes bacterium]|nr:T9SS type A sorting domain-containing protein [Bacteroidota bacterium]
MRKLLLVITVISIIFISGKPLHATHIWGAQLSYECIDPANFEYQITLVFYRDCGLGTAEADSAFYVTVYDTAGNYLNAIDRYKLSGNLKDTIPLFSASDCLYTPPGTCVKLNIYSRNIFMPPVPGGYYVVWQKCCRNSTIINIPNPLIVGTTVFVEVPDTSISSCNSTAQLNNVLPVIYCLNQPIQIDMSATDLDGDSLVYELYQPYDGGSPVNATPVPSPPKPYSNITYNGGYSSLNPLGSLDSLKIDSSTGLLTGTPDIVGLFIIGLAVSEYKNGQFVNKTRLDFNVSVVACDTIGYAAGFTSSDSLLTVDFHAISNAQSNTWSWDLGDGNIDSVQNPIHTYANSGTYWTCLIASDSCFSDTICDSITVFKPSSINEQGPGVGVIEIYPNPFKNTATIKYTLLSSAQVRIAIYNILGKEILLLSNSFKTSGRHELIYQAENLESGLYILKVMINSVAYAKKIAHVR